MGDLQDLQHRLLHWGGRVSIWLLTGFYFFILFMMTQQGWTFFGDGPGDLIVVCLFSALYVVALLLYRLAAKHRDLIWLHVCVLLIAGGCMFITPRYVRQLQGPDTRATQIDEIFPKTHHRH